MVTTEDAEGVCRPALVLLELEFAGVTLRALQKGLSGGVSYEVCLPICMR